MEVFDKKSLSETDIRTKYITPAIEKAGWNILTQVREEYPITQGRIIARGKTCKREAPLKADYVLFYKANKPIAVVEAKDNNHSPLGGLPQAIKYAIAHAKADDIIILAGKGHETYQILNTGTIHLDEREIVKEALEEVK